VGLVGANFTAGAALVTVAVAVAVLMAPAGP
jgi:hypothetical protein